MALCQFNLAERPSDLLQSLMQEAVMPLPCSHFSSSVGLSNPSLILPLYIRTESPPRLLLTGPQCPGPYPAHTARAAASYGIKAITGLKSHLKQDNKQSIILHQTGRCL